MAGAEAAVTDDTLGSFLALLEVATGLAGSHCGLRLFRGVVVESVWRERGVDIEVLLRKRGRNRE